MLYNVTSLVRQDLVSTTVQYIKQAGIYFRSQWKILYYGSVKNNFFSLYELHYKVGKQSYQINRTILRCIWVRQTQEKMQAFKHCLRAIFEKLWTSLDKQQIFGGFDPTMPTSQTRQTDEQALASCLSRTISYFSTQEIILQIINVNNYMLFFTSLKFSLEICIACFLN